MDLYHRIYEEKIFEEPLTQHITDSIEIIQSALRQFGLRSLAFSFNAGKDSMVLLHLLRIGFALHIKKETGEYPEHRRELDHLTSVYFEEGRNFPELVTFMRAMNDKYNLCAVVESRPIKPGLALLLEQKPYLKGIFIGVRRTDPYSENLQAFQRTDEGWPDVIRVSPILEWGYDDIWHFLRALDLEWCSLYDHGYTSIGAVTNTNPNPSLITDGGEYLPAWQLLDGTLERGGRFKQ